MGVILTGGSKILTVKSNKTSTKKKNNVRNKTNSNQNKKPIKKKRVRLKRKYARRLNMIVFSIVLCVFGYNVFNIFKAQASLFSPEESSTGELALDLESEEYTEKESEESMITIKEESSSDKVENVVVESKEEQIKPLTIDYDEQLLTSAGTTLSSDLETLNESYPNQISFMLVDRESGETIAYNEDKVYTSASLYKLFVTYAVLNKVDEGKLSLERPMDAVGGTVDSYITKTITLSANDTARALAELVTWDYVEEFIHENGFTNTTFNLYQSGGVTYTGTLQTNANDVTKIINQLYDNDLLTKASTTYFINQLNNQQLTYALNRGLTDEVSFAHKTGILDDVSHDAGVITYNDKEYVVTIMSDGWLNATNDASPMFDSIGSSIMNYLYNNK